VRVFQFWREAVVARTSALSGKHRQGTDGSDAAGLGPATDKREVANIGPCLITQNIVRDSDNSFREFWRTTYDISNSFILFVAIFALGVAYIQSSEAKKSRIAQVFIEIEGRWSSADLQTGKTLRVRLEKGSI